MTRWIHLIFFSILFIIFGIFSPVQVFAASNFATNYHVTYTVNKNGDTHAKLNMSLTNTTSEYYASSYKIQVGFDKITNVKASDADGQINPVIEKSEDGYTISLQFNKKVIGLDKKLDFVLDFDTPDVAEQYGKIWEIYIPGIADPDEFNSFIVEVKVPLSFGKPIFTKPYKPLDSLVFDKKQLNKSGISITFGDKQYYSFHLIYHLSNDNLYPIKTEIALPPSTNYQKVFISSINPSTENVTLDKDNNWLASFNLGPSEKKDVTVDGKAEIFLTPRIEELQTQNFAEYLEEKPYWQTKSNELINLAQELKTPEAIYNFVIKSLKYDFSRVTDDKPRLGALNALKNPDSAVCLEYTDLFIALARAAGIPAREVDGFAYTQNTKQRPLSLVKDILHAWPEYYDEQKKTWVMVDPTWGSTTGGVDYFSTLDFDHFAFVIKGIDSNYPIPAGGYKYISDKYTKDVSVSFAESLPSEENNFDIISNLPKTAMTLLPIKGDITVKNTGQTLLPPQALNITSSSLFPHEQLLQTPPIPPFGYANLKTSFQPESFLTNEMKNFSIRVNDQTVTQSIDISPLSVKTWWKLGAGIVVGGILIILIFIFSKKVFFQNRKR